MDYKLYHYDVIIYNKLESPILWTEPNHTHDNLGKVHAIPSEFVNHVIEVKSTFNAKNIKDGLKKLCELDDFKSYLPAHFKTSLIFIEMLNGVINKPTILKNFMSNLPYSFNESLILRTQVNDDMVGITHFQKLQDEEEKITPLVKDIDKLLLYKTDNGLKIEGGGTSLQLHKDNRKKGHYHIIKGYSSTIHHIGYMVSLRWSFNEFSDFSLRFLNILHPSNSINYGSSEYGRIYNVVNPKE